MDECETLIGDCQQICTNTIGSFSCSCTEGYELQMDNTCQGRFTPARIVLSTLKVFNVCMRCSLITTWDRMNDCSALECMIVSGTSIITKLVLPCSEPLIFISLPQMALPQRYDNSNKLIIDNNIILFPACAKYIWCHSL